MVTSGYAFAMALGALVAPRVYLNPLNAKDGLTPINGVTLDAKTYRGKKSVVLTEGNDPQFGVLGAVFPLDFKNGTIEFDAAGQLTALHNPTSRSFVGIAFRVSDDLKKYECFYLRMTNGRSSSQELRNHAVQYCMCPDHLWNQLRVQYPFRYESYADLELGAWTHVKISVCGSEAKFYVGKAKQPTLVVHDLFMGSARGKIALWVGGYTRAYFANLRVRTF